MLDCLSATGTGLSRTLLFALHPLSTPPLPPLFYSPQFAFHTLARSDGAQAALAQIDVTYLSRLLLFFDGLEVPDIQETYLAVEDLYDLAASTHARALTAADSPFDAVRAAFDVRL